MITLKQLEHNLLGAEKDIAGLAAGKSARILVISDTHGRKDLFRSIVEKEGPACNALVFCGDGAGDFAACMDMAATDGAFAACVPSVAAFVKGNGDSDRFPVCFNPGNEDVKEVCCELTIPRRQTLSAAGHTVCIVHGHEQGVYYGTTALTEEAGTAGADIILYGHTHIACEIRSRIYMVNPGSTSHPRAGTPPSFAVLELEESCVNTVFFRIEATLQGVRFIPFMPKKAYLWG
jgi:putative phosphoesterase